MEWNKAYTNSILSSPTSRHERTVSIHFHLLRFDNIDTFLDWLLILEENNLNLSYFVMSYSFGHSFLFNKCRFQEIILCLLRSAGLLHCHLLHTAGPTRNFFDFLWLIVNGSLFYFRLIISVTMAGFSKIIEKITAYNIN